MQNSQVDTYEVLLSIIHFHGQSILTTLHSLTTTSKSRLLRIASALFLIECFFKNEKAQSLICESLFEFTPIEGLVVLNASVIKSVAGNKEQFRMFKEYTGVLEQKCRQDQKSNAFKRKYWVYPEVPRKSEKFDAK